MNATMPAITFHPGPSQRNGPSAIGDGHQQQLMSKANFAAIHDQADFSMRQALDDHLGQRFIPRSHLDGWVIQQPSQPAGHAWQASTAGDALSHFAQMHRSAFVQANHQPTEIANPGDPFSRTKLAQHFATGMVQFWYRHGSPRKLVSGNPSLLEGHADFYSFVKTVR